METKQSFEVRAAQLYPGCYYIKQSGTKNYLTKGGIKSLDDFSSDNRRSFHWTDREEAEKFLANYLKKEILRKKESCEIGFQESPPAQASQFYIYNAETREYLTKDGFYGMCGTRWKTREAAQEFLDNYFAQTKLQEARRQMKEYQGEFNKQIDEILSLLS